MSEQALERRQVEIAPQQAPTQSPNLMQIVAGVAAGKATAETAEVVDRLLAAYHREEDRNREASFNRDFACAKREMPVIPKNGKVQMGEKGSYDFAKYEDVQACIGPIEEKWGFVRSFESVPSKEGIFLRLVMRHKDGHVDRGSAVELPPDSGAGRNGMQARRSSMGYAKRGLTMDYWDLRVIGADNDGRTAEPISQKQADEINDMLKELGMDAEAKKRFLKFAEADSVSKIQRHNFEKCLRALEQKRRQG